jgi:alpha-tubulin suppressor-like RCC1 family protein/molecular chaperone DnaK (HSP70)
LRKWGENIVDYTVVGIDFGPSATVVKVKNYYEAETIQANIHALQFDNSNLIPTLVFEDSGGRFYFGKEALYKGFGQEGLLHENFMMGLINNSPDIAKKAKELTQIFFKYIFSKFNENRANLNVLPEVRTYISYPEKWDHGTKHFIINCAEKAGFTNVKGAGKLSAAISALIPHNLEHLQRNGIIHRNEPVSIMVLDMDALTTDISISFLIIGADGKIVDCQNQTSRPLPDRPDCGGREIEEKLKEELINYVTKISKNGQVSTFLDKQIKGTMKQWTEQHLAFVLKEKRAAGLPGRLLEIVLERQEEGIYENIPFEKIDRQRFESITEEYWKRLRELIDGALRNTSEKLSGFRGAGDIDLVVLTGMYSNWYAVSELILGNIAGCVPLNFTKIKENPSRILQEPSPQETVAFGLVKMDMVWGKNNAVNSHDSEPINIEMSESGISDNTEKIDNTDYTVVGIDFGTSTTVVKVRNYYEAGTTPTDHTLQFDGSNLLPTLIFEDSEGNLSFGKAALNKESDRKSDREHGEQKGQLYENFKMKLTGDGSKEDKEAQKRTKEFFKHIYSRFNEERVNYGVLEKVKTYVSYPVKWEKQIRRFMIECAEDEEFTNVEGVDEASAAIYAAIPNHLENLQKEGILRGDKPVNVMMLDMGAGTTDIAIFNLKIGADKKLVVGNPVTWPPAGKQNCGGREIEEYMAVELENYIKKISKKEEVKENIKKIIKDSVKEWKEINLSPRLKDRKSVDLPNRMFDSVCQRQDDGTYENIQFEKIDRQRFETITGEYWKQLRGLIAGALSSASEKMSGFTGAGDIDLIILTGGHSKWYGVSEFLKGEKFANCEPIDFTKIRNNPSARLLQESSPQETVALGLVKMDEAKKKWFNLNSARGKSAQGLSEYRERAAKYQKCIAASWNNTMGKKSNGTVVVTRGGWKGWDDTENWQDIVAVAAGNDHTVGLKADGTTAVVKQGLLGGWGKPVIWQNIAAVAAGFKHTVGLKADGTVVAVGNNKYGQCDTGVWKDFAAIAAGCYHTVGLKTNGKVVVIGHNEYGQCDTGSWRDIAAIASGYYHTVGLKADGTVVAVGYNGDCRCDTEGWRDIVAVSACWGHTVGLKADGTVVAVGNNKDGRCDTEGWRDIVTITAGEKYTFGLKADGTVVAVGNNESGQCDIGSWRDIVAVAVSDRHTVGLKADGTVVAVGSNSWDQCNTGSWTNIGPASDK